MLGLRCKDTEDLLRFVGTTTQSHQPDAMASIRRWYWSGYQEVGLLAALSRSATALRYHMRERTWESASPTAKGTTASTGAPGGEEIEVSKRLPRRFPAGSSKVPRTTSLYAPGRHGALGVNVQVLSPLVSRARPATRRPRASAIAR